MERRPWSIDLIPQRHSFFAPAERDIYSDEHTRKDLAPLGAKPSGVTIVAASKIGCAS